MKNAKVLVTGGAGFIGTQVVNRLRSSGANVVVVDHNQFVQQRDNLPATVIKADYLDYMRTIEYGMFNVVIHLAADHLVEQSVRAPYSYYENNVLKMKEMLDICRKLRLNIIFSSSGNVYGRQGANGPLTEDLYYDPENPYASTKVAGELLLKDYSIASVGSFNHVTFRYFNAAGADPQANNGYVQSPATHVIPILCQKIADNKEFSIYGSDYPTLDGTCVRDYVHVDDLARAHVLAVKYLLDGGSSTTLNIGGGSGGVSVKDLVTAAEEVVGKKAIVKYADRRIGDPAQLIADINKAHAVLGWSPVFSIKDSVSHAWNWHKKHTENR